MKRLLVLLIFVVFIVLGCTFLNPEVMLENKDELSDWIGDYEYGASFPPAVPTGAPKCEVYTVSIYQNNGIYLADIIADGWMLGINARARVQGDENSIELIFLEYPDASMEFFQTGDVILSFTKNKQDIITKWISIAPGLGSDKEVEGIYFTKVEN